MSDAIRQYEAVIILHGDASPADQKAVFKKNADIIGNFKGRVNHIDTWGKRNFGNTLKKQSRGLYYHTTFEADPQAVAEIERVMRINEKVLRFQHTRLKENTDLAKYVTNFKEMLAANAIKEKEREAKFQAKRAARAAERGRGDFEDRGDRPERGDRGDRGDRGGRERF